jgi:hypothetical protein
LESGMRFSRCWISLFALVAAPQLLGCTDAAPRGDAMPKSHSPKETELTASVAVDDEEITARLKKLMTKIGAIEKGDEEVQLDNSDSREIPLSLDPRIGMLLTTARDFSRGLSESDYNAVVRKIGRASCRERV